MKLNPKKRSFGVEEGKFLGHFITKKGIKANPSKVKAITYLQPSKTLKDIQSLNEKLAALSRFLSKGADKSLPFFKTLKGRVAKWPIELGEHEIEFKGRNFNKGQILADFLEETPSGTGEGKDREAKEVKPIPP
ncbi:hypothetical protein Tco_1483913 [Tanacetum coccineum]